MKIQEVQHRRRRRLMLTMGAVAALVLVTLIAVQLERMKTLPGGTAPITDPDAPNAPATTIFERAEAYYFGRGVPQNYREAAALYEQAARDGFAPAENALGRMYENGIGIPKDLERAVKYYKQAASKGHPDAKAALARLEVK